MFFEVDEEAPVSDFIGQFRKMEEVNEYLLLLSVTSNLVQKSWHIV